MAEPRRASDQKKDGFDDSIVRAKNFPGTWVEPETADDLLSKLTNLHRQTERHDELLGVYETLHESERRFREMIDVLPAAIYTTDAEGSLTHFNPAAVRLSGRTPQLGTDQWCVTWKLFLPDGTPMRHDECPMAVALKEGRIIDGTEVIAERPDGTRFWFTPFPRVLRDAEGRITGGLNMLIDITDRKQAEGATNLLAAIVDSSDDAIVSKSLDGIITSWNRSAERLFGYKAEEVIGHHITLIVPPDRLHEEATILQRLNRAERVDHFETQRIRKDGTILDVSLTISPVKDGTGRLVGASKVARDITELKKTEGALRESEGRYRALFESVPVAVFVCDCHAVIQHYNQRAVELWGREPVCGVEKHCGSVKLILPDGSVLPHDQSPIVEVLRTGKPALHVEVSIERPDGTQLPVLVNFAALRNAEGEITGAVTSFVDITEIKWAEAIARESEERFRDLAGKLDTEVRVRTEQLEQRNSEALQQADRLRELSTRLMQSQDDERRRIARELHDSVGQDLAALGMCMEAAKRAAKELPPVAAQKFEEASEIIEKCSSEIRTLSHLLHPPLLEELGLASAIDWYVSGFASRSGIEVKLQIPPKFKRLDQPIEMALFRVLQECLTNIHRHSGSKTATVKVEADEQQVSLEVSDQGTGIGKGIEKPTRGSKVGAGKQLGIGINGMRERLKDLGGSLEIHSTNQGTTARASIPLLSKGFTAPE